MRRFFCALASVLLSTALVFPAAAGSWRTGQAPNDNRWWYDYGSGNYARNGWQWIDGNGDGIAECYYFDADGWMYAGARTPDGALVDKNGAWVKDGKVQTRQLSAEELAAAAQPASQPLNYKDIYNSSYMYDYTEVYVLNNTTKQYELASTTTKFATLLQQEEEEDEETRQSSRYRYDYSYSDGYRRDRRKTQKKNEVLTVKEQAARERQDMGISGDYVPEYDIMKQEDQSLRVRTYGKKPQSVIYRWEGGAWRTADEELFGGEVSFNKNIMVITGMYQVKGTKIGNPLSRYEGRTVMIKTYYQA